MNANRHDRSRKNARERRRDNSSKTAPWSWSHEAAACAAETQALRYIATLLGLYGMCGRRACRRARACNGAPRDCLARYAPLVPEDARDGVKAMLDGQWEGRSFEEVLDEARAEIVALGKWGRTVDASLT